MLTASIHPVGQRAIQPVRCGDLGLIRLLAFNSQVGHRVQVRGVDQGLDLVLKSFKIQMDLFCIYLVTFGDHCNDYRFRRALNQVIGVFHGSLVEVQNGGGIDHQDTAAISFNPEVQPVLVPLIRRCKVAVHARREGLFGREKLLDRLKEIGHIHSVYFEKMGFWMGWIVWCSRANGQPPPHSGRNSQVRQPSGTSLRLRRESARGCSQIDFQGSWSMLPRA